MNLNLARQLRQDEAERPCVYLDSLGYSTIGVGRLVDARKPGAGLRRDEMDLMLANDIDDRTQALHAYIPWFGQLDDARQGVLLNMAFQLGTHGLLAFKRTLGHVRVGDYAQAADEMLQSRWAKQTPQRAERLARQMITGEWVFQ